MTNRIISNSKILDAVHETARALQQYAVGNRGRHPSGPSLKLLNILEKKGLEALI